MSTTLGLKQLPKKGGEFLFKVVMRRHELRSTVVTSNRPIEDRGKLLGNVPSATIRHGPSGDAAFVVPHRPAPPDEGLLGLALTVYMLALRHPSILYSMSHRRSPGRS